MRKVFIWILGLIGVLGSVNGFANGPFEILSKNVTSFESYNSESQIVLSGEDGVITCWRSARKGRSNTNLYVQKVDPEGKILWEHDGTPVCPFPGNQTNFSMVSDGFGGAVIVWEDGRQGNDNPKIFVQRINLRGEPLWGQEALQVCTFKGAQRRPRIISDKRNGFYIVWHDNRRGPNEADIYAQHINLGGKANWMSEGLPIVTHPNQQKNITLATDEKHYLYVMWEDFRNGLYWNLYGQKLDRQGNFFWKAGGIDVFAGVEENHHNPSIVPDGYGGLVFAYEKYSRETKGYDVFRGRINSVGKIIYHYSTCNSQSDQRNPKIAKRGPLVVICWEDKRHGNWDIYAQTIRINDGVFEWELNGVPVCRSSGDDISPYVISSSVYNYQVFSWLKEENGTKQLYVQKLNNLGAPAWKVGGRLICRASEQQLMPTILDDDKGGLWMAWTDERRPRNTRIFVQHVGDNGENLLPSSGIDLHPQHTQVYAEVKSLEMIPGENGDFFLAWEDFRNGSENADIYIQKFDLKGNPKWRRSGIPVCLAPGEQGRPVLISDGAGGAIILWGDRRNNLDDNIYAQRINSNGKMIWRSTGLPVCTASEYQGQIRAVSDGNEGVILCWSDARSFMSTGFDLYIQRISKDGDLLWGRQGRALARNPELQTSPSITSDGLGGAYLAWADSRDGFANIFVQHIDANGNNLWEQNGRGLYTNNYHQRTPQVLKNFEDDAFIAWEDARQGDNNEKIYIQAMSPNGSKIWGMPGQAVCNLYGRQTKPTILTDDYGSLWVTWLDERSKMSVGVKLVAQRFDLGGNAQWQEEGITLGTDLPGYGDFEAALNSRGYAYYVWNQLNDNQTHTVYYQKLSPEGTAKYGTFGNKLGGVDVDQLYPVLTINSAGRALVCWVQRDPETNSFSIKGVPVLE